MQKPYPPDIFSTEKLLLSKSGIFPVKNATLFSKICGFITYVASFLLLITFIMELIFTESLLNSLDIFKLLFIHGCFVFKLSNFLIKGKDINEIEDLMTEDMFNIHVETQYHYIQDKMDNIGKVANIYRLLCGTYLTLLITFPFFDDPNNIKLPMSGWYGFDISKYFVEVYIFQAIAISMSAYNNSSMDFFNCKLINMASAQMDVLMENLRNCVPDNCDDEMSLNAIAEKRLKICIEHHLIIIRYEVYLCNNFL